MFGWLASIRSKNTKENEGKEGEKGECTSNYSNLYDEASECLLASMAIYGFADVRQLAASHPKLAHIIELPKPRTELLRAFVENEDDIKKQANLDTSLYMSALDALAPDLRQYLDQKSSVEQDPVQIVVFDDEQSNLELVYSIAVDHNRKLLRVTFRGSTTVTDWAHDADIRMELMDNPLRKLEMETEKPSTIRQSTKIGLHAGFRKYLFSPAKNSQDGEKVPRSAIIECVLPPKVIKTGAHCKYDIILRRLKLELEKYPHYHIQVTGHSLGGALCTLLAFCLACELSLPPVTCISFASPRCGNGNFSRAFQELEHRGRLRNLRVANAEDVVTAMPDSSFSYSFMTQLLRRNFFLHTGVCLTLPDTEAAQWGYPRVGVTKDDHVGHDWRHRTENLATRVTTLRRAFSGQADFLKWHSCGEYLRRLQREREQLTAKTFDDIYDVYFQSLPQQD